MFKKYTLDELDEKSVSVKTQDYVVAESQEYPIGQPYRKAYDNNIRGREEIISELPQTQQNAIMALWGDTPTV